MRPGRAFSSSSTASGPCRRLRRRLQQEFSVSGDQSLSDVIAFLASLRDKKLIAFVERPESGGPRVEPMRSLLVPVVCLGLSIAGCTQDGSPPVSEVTLSGAAAGRTDPGSRSRSRAPADRAGTAPIVRGDFQRGLSFRGDQHPERPHRHAEGGSPGCSDSEPARTGTRRARRGSVPTALGPGCFETVRVADGCLRNSRGCDHDRASADAWHVDRKLLRRRLAGG